MIRKQKLLSVLLALMFFLSVAAPLPGLAADVAGEELVLLSTTDLHGYVYPVNYFNGRNLRGTLSRVATVVEGQREKHDNVMLFDAGDTIQGSQLAHYWGLVNPSRTRGLEHVMAKAMNFLGYDAMTLGNHEFQIGKASLDSFVKDADFPVLSANTVQTASRQAAFAPYTLIDKELASGKTVTVGVLGLTTPRWVQWYGSMVNYEYDSTDMLEAARVMVPRMKAEGADVVVALIHSGLTDEEQNQTTAGAENLLPENDALKIATTVPDIDVVFYGHSHRLNAQKATASDGDEVLLVQGKWHGRGVGKAVLDLVPEGSGWKVAGLTGDVSLVTDAADAPVEPSAALMAHVASYHDEVMKYMATVIGKTTVELDSRPSRYADTSLFQLIAKAQRWAVEDLYADTATDALKHPVLSMVAPFLTGANGPDDYTLVEAGDLSLSDVGAIYLYDDLLQAIEIDGASLKAYLERAAENFLQVTPGSGDQPILNPDFHGYYFDMIEGLTYRIDITKPAGSRIVDLKHEGAAVGDKDMFTLLVPNFRAGGGGGFPGTGPDATVTFNRSEGIETRDVLIEYIKKVGVVDLAPAHDWGLVPNFLKHWSADHVYPLFRDGVILGEEQTGRLNLNQAVSRDEFMESAGRIMVVSNALTGDTPVTRGEVIPVLAAALREAGLSASAASFTDLSGDLAADGALLRGLKVLSGYPDGTVRPERTLTRGEMAALLNLCRQAVEK